MRIYDLSSRLVRDDITASFVQLEPTSVVRIAIVDKDDVFAAGLFPAPSFAATNASSELKGFER